VRSHDNSTLPQIFPCTFEPRKSEQSYDHYLCLDDGQRLQFRRLRQPGEIDQQGSELAQAGDTVLVGADTYKSKSSLKVASLKNENPSKTQKTELRGFNL
jgi:hypothetical protein